MFIKEIDKNGMVARQGELKSGDVILKVCIYTTDKLLVICFASQLLSSLLNLKEILSFLVCNMCTIDAISIFFYVYFRHFIEAINWHHDTNFDFFVVFR